MENAAFVGLIGVLGYLTGFIWMVQIFQYPAFLQWQTDHFSQLHKEHTQKITLLVAPAMIIELILAVFLFFTHPIHLLLTLVNWAQTFLISVPIHEKLGQQGKLDQEILRLIQWNWIRTVTWSFHFLWALISQLTLNSLTL